MSTLQPIGNYGLSRHLDISYEEAVEKVTASLKEQGFGILTTIDVKSTLKQKIDKDFTKYIILGACNPNLAYRALQTEIDIGLLLPCNVTVYEEPGTGRTVVTAMDPNAMVAMTGRKELAAVAGEARTKIEAALSAL